MPDLDHCPRCGAVLSADTGSEGLCPACMMERGLEERSAEETTRLAPAAEPPTDRIGPYRLLQKLGEGGMGEVWLAEQEKPVRRKVALKIIKRGMDSRQVVARFESERQALAMMDHPNISKVFDAGATDQGRPYFVMEHVKGIPITSHCDRHRLSTSERLTLFMQVCEGVQHAHQKGIIHRDIKPSNVLVTVQDGKAVPKIIDFGVAKATQQRLTEHSVFTELGVLIGTPEYMSPEQADLTAQDIDTRTDVYSLGVLLYQLLAGALPFESKELRRAGFDEIRRRIREEDPPKPSTRLSTLSGEQTAEAARARRTDPTSLRRQLAGDLDWITMRALEKDRTRRYGSPNELAAELRRHLEHEPVLAGPPSAGYRTKKFVRRHRAGVSFAAVLLLVLIGVAVTMTVQAGRIARERDRANAEAQRANEEAVRANQEADTANRVSQFMVRLFEIPDPGEARGNSITAREILDRGSKLIERGLKDEPLIRARMMATMGKTYRGLGVRELAKELLERSLAIREAQLTADDPIIATNLFWLGLVDSASTREYLERCLAIRRKVLAPDDPELANAIAGAAYYEDTHAEAEALFREARAIFIQQAEQDWRAANNAMLLARVIVLSDGDLQEAVELTDEAVETYERIRREGGYWPPAFVSPGIAGDVYMMAGEADKAIELKDLLLRHAVNDLGPDHIGTASEMSSYASYCLCVGRFAEARAMFERALPIIERVHGPDSAATGYVLRRFSSTVLAQGDYREALPLWRRTLTIYERFPGPGYHGGRVLTLLHLALNLYRLGETDEAREYYRRAIELQVAGGDSAFHAFGVNSAPRSMQFHHELAVLVREAGHEEDALKLFEIAATQADKSPWWNAYPDKDLPARIHEDYAELLRRMGRNAEAAEHETQARILRDGNREQS